MTDMFIPKKEKILIISEAIIYILLIVLGSYFTICGNVFIRMIPILYFLGVFGVVMFNKPVVTIILGAISIFTFGCLIESEINVNTILLAVYSAFMIGFGEATGYILNLLYENMKLRRFIKYYHKIAYIIGLVVAVFIPLFLNNIVNSNMISYIIAKKNINKYINENYAYSECYIKETEYVPSYYGGMYEFVAVIDGIEVKLNCDSKNEIADINMEDRKTQLDKMINAGMNILLKDNRLTSLEVNCRYEYSKVTTIPDIIRINVSNVQSSELDKMLKFIEVLKNWNEFEKIDRVDIYIDNAIVSINKEDLTQKDITEEYILDGMKHEFLDSKEGI